MSMITRSISHINFTGTHKTPSSLSPRFQTDFFFNPICDLRVHNHRLESSYLVSQSLQYLVSQYNSKTKRNLVVYASVPPQQPPADQTLASSEGPGGLPGSLKKWLAGIFFTILIPLLTNKWGAISNWANKLETTLQSVENIVETVEEVAEKVEKLAEDVLDDMPESKLKTALRLCLELEKLESLSRVERVAEHVAEDAKKIDDMIDKVQEVEDKLEAYIEAEQEKEAARKDKNGKKN